MYFKFFRKRKWRKDAPQMTGDRVFRGDHNMEPGKFADRLKTTL